MMAVSIPDSFYGYVEIDNKRYAYSVDNHLVKLLPAFEGNDGQNTSNIDIIQLTKGEDETYKYICGHDENLHQIALLQLGNLKSSFIGASFFAPIIIKSMGNADGFYNRLTKSWTQFDAITFSGGIIDALYNPKIAALRLPTVEEQKTLFANSDGMRTIKIKSFRDYTKSILVDIDGQTATLVLSVSQVGSDSNINTTDLGFLSSFIQLEFKNPQDFISIHRYCRTINTALAVFSLQKNINFEVSIKQKNRDDILMKTGICKVFLGSEDFYQPKSHQIVPILVLFDYLPQILKIINDGTVEALLALLPVSNKNRKSITSTNVQDLCAALEAEYNVLSSTTPTVRDEAIQQLREKIKETIRDFAVENKCIDTNKETTISSCFKYLDLDLKSKIFMLYKQHETAIDDIMQKYQYPEMTIDNITKFLELRNTKAHVGKTIWNESANLYIPLMALTYACFFARAGVPSEKISSLLLKMF
jgi:hypothetical protein